MNGDGFAPSLAVVSCSFVESKGSEMMDIQPLDVLGNKKSLIQLLLIGWLRGTLSGT